MGARIAGVGKSLPARVLTNADLEKMVETSDQWIVDRTGIRERRLAAEHESSASLGSAAAAMALKTAAVDASDIDLIICATSTPDGHFPATASLIQHAIGAGNAGAFDVNSACAGFLPAFATGAQFINAGIYKRVLVVGAEVMSRIVDWSDRSTCVLFGDGAGAVLLEAHERGGPGSVVLKSDGGLAKILYSKGPCAAPLTLTEAEGFSIVMDGPTVFRVAVRAMEDVTRQAISNAGLDVRDIDIVVPHQANARIISAMAKGLGLPAEKVIVNLDKYGNTSSASIPIALCEAWEEGRLRPGDNVVFVAIGGGLAWGATVVEWVGIGPLASKPDEALKPVGVLREG
jgi:3-oxoacyl-[acyl-carrier-protein] synthase-3